MCCCHKRYIHVFFFLFFFLLLFSHYILLGGNMKWNNLHFSMYQIKHCVNVFFKFGMIFYLCQCRGEFFFFSCSIYFFNPHFSLSPFCFSSLSTFVISMPLDTTGLQDRSFQSLALCSVKHLKM